MTNQKQVVISFPFRSFHNQKFDGRTAIFLILPLIFNFLVLCFINPITQFWGSILEYALPKLGFDGTIIYSQYYLFNKHFLLPAINIQASLPSVTLWGATLFFSLSIFIMTYLLNDAFTPLKYFTRVFIIILWIAQLYIMIFPNGFMYNIFLYTKSGFMQILSLLFIIPWIFLMSYYLFGYNFLNKIMITCLSLIYFIILAPIQYLLNSCLIHMFSLMMMTPLFFFAGLMIDILAIIAFLSYGLSQEPLYNKYSRDK